MKITKLFIAVLSLVISGRLLAADYQLDTVHTQILFSVNHLGFSTSTGSSVDFEGGFSFDENAVESSSAYAEIQIGSIEFNDEVWNDTMLGKMWFDLSNFPTMTFKSTQVTSTGEGTMLVIGDLTLKGITRPVTLDVILNKVGEQMGVPKAGFSATAIIDRTEFGMSTFAPMIGSEVKIIIQVEGERR